MKRYFVILSAAVAALFAVSCTKETPVDTVAPTGMKEVTLTASVSEVTKTSYDAQGTFSWTKGDQISVRCINGEDVRKYFTFTAKESGATVTFSGLVDDGFEVESEAFFPACDQHDWVSWQPYFYTPEYKDMKGSASADLPMFGKATDGTYHFTHMSGAALLTFTNFPEAVKTAEISIVNAALKISGKFKVSYSGANNEYMKWNSANAETDSEKTFTRVVPVVDNTAKVYLPYIGELWGDSSVTIKGYDAGNNEYVLVENLKMGGRGSSSGIFERGQVVPYAPYKLPVLLSAIDWTKGTTCAGSSAPLTDLTYFADAENFYVRLQCSKAALAQSDADKLTVFLYDVLDGTTGNGFWDNFNGSTGNVEFEVPTEFGENYALDVKIDGQNVSSKTVVSDELVTWSFAFPRTISVLTAPGKAYFGMMLQDASGNSEGSIPSTANSLLEVTLP